MGGHLNSVVGLLLRHNKVEIRTLGARLLAQFEKVQVGTIWHLCSRPKSTCFILTGSVRVLCMQGREVLLQQCQDVCMHPNIQSACTNALKRHPDHCILQNALAIQVDSDYVDQLEQFVPLVCANCETRPVGLYDPSPEHVRALNVVCMQALRQHLALARRISFTSRHLEHMMNVALDTLVQPASDMDMADACGDDMDSMDPVNRRSSGQTLSWCPSHC